MARRIATSDFINFGMGRVGTDVGQRMTIAVLCKMLADGTGLTLLRCYNSGFTTGWEIRRDTDNKVKMILYKSTGSTFYSATSTFTVADGWCVIIVRKWAVADGNPMVFYKLPLSGSLSGESPVTAMVDYDTGMTNLDIAFTNMDIACAAIWSSIIGSTGMGNLNTHTFYPFTQAQLDWGGGPNPPDPIAMWRFNQAAITTPVPDYLRQGSDETGKSGTSVVADPAAMTFSSERRIEKPAIYMPSLSQAAKLALVK